MTRPGFTLIEMLAMVVLIGLLATATAISLADEAQRATRADAVARLAGADANARLAARRLGPSTLRFDLDKHRLWLVTPDADSGEPRPGHSMQLPRGFRIAELTWIDPTPPTRQSTRPRKRVVHEAGRVELPISSEGMTRTYVIKLIGPPDETDGGSTNDTQTTWLLFSGLTGQAIQEDDANAIENMLDVLASTRPDAD